VSAAGVEKIVATFKTLGEPVRLRLYSKIVSHPGGEACVCDGEEVGVSQSTVSHYLKKYCEVSLLTSQRRGTWV
jgi:ArsR family transcriptional regulator